MKITKTFDTRIEKKGTDGGRIVISTGSPDRDQDRVMPQGARIENYLKNPVVQWGHDYYSPHSTVGRSLGLEIQELDIVADFELRPAANDYDPQNIVRLLWEGGWINSASIGFIPLKFEENEFGGRDFLEWELIEWSLVPVPANQSALRLAVKALGLDGELPPAVADEETTTLYEAKVTDDLVAEMKRGRVLSARNEERIRNAANGLQEVLSELETEGDREDGQAAVSASHLGDMGDIAKGAMPYRDHGMADMDMEWSGPAMSDFSDVPFADMDAGERRRIAAHFAWARVMPPESMADLKFPHHAPMHEGVGPAVWRGVTAAMQRLLSTGDTRPDVDDRQGVYDHLASHYRQFDKEPPEFRAYSAEELKSLFPAGDALTAADEEALAIGLGQFVLALKPIL